MKRYIDADKLKAEIERRRLSNRYIDTEGYEAELFEIINSLQLEQPEVDLEKEIKDTCRGYRINDYHEQELGKHDIENIALNFYELGLNAKKEE